MLFVTSKLWIHKDFLSVFRDKEIDQFPVIYNCDFGTLVRGERRKSVKFFSLIRGEEEIGFYLKKQHVTFIDTVKYILRFGKLMKLSTRHELDLINFYESQKVDIVRAVAWGEIKFLCFPVRGLLIQEEVKGLEFVDLVKNSNSQQRIQLIKAYGRLVGELHSKGLLSSIVRVTDIICTVADDDRSTIFKLVVIDRERGRLSGENPTLEQVSKILANILVRFVLYIDMPNVREVYIFLRAYVSQMDCDCEFSVRNLYNKSRKQFYPLMNAYDEYL